MKKFLIAVSVFSLFAACSPSSQQNENKEQGQPSVIKIDGSSTVYPVSEAVAEDYNKVKPDVKVTIGISGTGGGFKKFINKEIDIADASRPIKTVEAHKCDSLGIKYIEVPFAYDGIAIVVNPKNTWVDKITTDELKTIWDASSQGKIMTWNQVRKSWPNKPLKLFAPSTDNGTFDYFTEAINGKAQQSRGDYTASATPNMLVQGIANDENALGYFGLAYYSNNKDKLKLIPVVNSKDSANATAILPSAETVENGTYKPLSRVLFVYVNTDAYARPEVKDFLTFYLQDVPKIISDVGYFPLQNDLYPIVTKRLQDGTTGSIYTNGSEQGTTLEGLLNPSAAQK